MIVYGATPSPFYRKVAVAFEEKGLSFDRKDMAPFPKTPELLAMHPLGKIPILEDGGTFIPDSSVICAYLERVHPEPSLYPSDPKDFARALFLEEYADTKGAEVIGGIFFERFVKPNLFQQETDEARVSELVENDLPGVLDYVESQIPEGRDTLLDEFSIADVAFGAHLGGLLFANIEIDASRWPRTAAYLKAVLARPSFQKVMAG